MTLLTTFLMALILSGCGTSVTTTVELKKITAPSITNLSKRHASESALRTGGVGANSNITIASLKVPIREITLLKEIDSNDGAQVVYECAANTNDGCLVEIYEAAALENLLAGAAGKSISTGTYTGVQISTCVSEGAYTGKIKASGPVEPNGETIYYTGPADGSLSTNVADYAESTVYFSGCARVYPLPNPAVITEAGGVTLRLYFDPRDIAFFGDVALPEAGESYYAGGYSYTYPTAPTGTYVGVNYMDVAGTLDSGSPTVSRFRVSSSYGFIGTFGFMYTSGGDYFGGYTRSFFSVDSTVAGNWFVTPIKSFTNNSDGTFTLSNYGSTSTGPGYFNTSVFQMSAASGLTYTESEGSSRTYSIEVLD